MEGSALAPAARTLAGGAVDAFDLGLERLQRRGQHVGRTAERERAGVALDRLQAPALVLREQVAEQREVLRAWVDARRLARQLGREVELLGRGERRGAGEKL